MVCIVTYRSTLVNDEKYIGLDVHQARWKVKVPTPSAPLRAGSKIANIAI
jgi:hypothetical protein